MFQEKRKSSSIMESLKFVAPGTPLREGLENILKAKTGGLVVLGDNEDVMNIISGGFIINMDFSPSCLYELAKMDGGIILSADGKKIRYANVQLNPDNTIPTSETGIRHRTAERVAKQTGHMVISISRRRNVITIYKGDEKYVLQDTGKVLAKANQAIQTLEKYKAVLDQGLMDLTALEFEDLATLQDVCIVLQRTERAIRVGAEIEKYIIELGDEGRLVRMQLDQLLRFVVEDGINVFEDYKKGLVANPFKEGGITDFSPEDLLNLTSFSKLLGYTKDIYDLERPVTPRGYRILSRIPRLPNPVIKNIVDYFGDFPSILKATKEELLQVEGIGEVRARYIKEGLKRLKEQVLLESHILKK